MSKQGEGIMASEFIESDNRSFAQGGGAEEAVGASQRLLADAEFSSAPSRSDDSPRKETSYADRAMCALSIGSWAAVTALTVEAGPLALAPAAVLGSQLYSCRDEIQDMFGKKK